MNSISSPAGFPTPGTLAHGDLSAETAQHLQQSRLDSAQTVKDISTLAQNFQSSATGKTGNYITNGNGAPQLDGVTVDFSAEDMAALLVALQGKTQEAQLANAKEGLNVSKKKLEDQNQRAMEKIKDWIQKCADAAAKEKAGGIFGWFKKIFSAVASLVGVVCAAIATAATGGAAAPLLALALVSLASTCVSLASEIDKAKGGKGFDHVLEWMDPGSLVGKGVGALAKSLGASEETAAIISACAAVATTITIAIVAAVATGGAGATGQLSNLSKLASTAQKVGSLVEAGAGIATGAAQATEAGLDIAAAADYRDGTKAQADKQAIDAAIAKLLHQMEQEHDDVKKVLDEMMEGMNIVNQMINAAGESHLHISANMRGQGQMI